MEPNSKSRTALLTRVEATVLLSAGNLVSADGRVFYATDCFIKQAPLTGEPYPVEKAACATPKSTRWALDDRACVLIGSMPVIGSAQLDIACTGSATALAERWC